MKRIVSLIAVLFLIVSLASCKKDANTSADGSEDQISLKVKNETYKEEFKDSEGTVICSLNMSYPVVKCADNEAIGTSISGYFESLKAAEIDSIKSNLQNTKDFNSKFNLDGITATKIVCTEYSRDNFQISFVITKQNGINPDDDNGTATSCSFSLADGKQLLLSDLYLSNSDECDERIKAAIVEEANISYSVRGADLSEDQLKLLDGMYNTSGFCCTDSQIVFLYSFDTLSSGSRDGFYYCCVNFEALDGVIMSPEQYYRQCLNS